LEGGGKAVEVEARLTWPPALYDKLLVRSAQMQIAEEGAMNWISLGMLQVDADGMMRGDFPTTGLPAGRYQLEVEAKLANGFLFRSAIRRFTLIAPTPIPIAIPKPTPKATTPAASGTFNLESYTPFTEPSYWGNDCYSNFKVEVGDGSFSSGYSWKDDGCGVGPPYYSGSVTVVGTWTSPPSSLAPGDTLSMSATCTSSAKQTGGGRNSGGGGWVYMTLNPPANNLGGRFRNSVKFVPSVNATGWSGDFPISDSKAGDVVIPQGKPGDVLVIVPSWNGPGGMGWGVYKYVCK
jgi:hypothetical protein